MSQKSITVKLLNKTFQVNCPEGKEPELQKAALFLNQKMKEIRNFGRVIELERIAVMTALNLSHELLVQLHEKEILLQKVSLEIDRLQKKIDKALIVNERDEIES